jgi:hypothetical protein
MSAEVSGSSEWWKSLSAVAAERRQLQECHHDVPHMLLAVMRVALLRLLLKAIL